MARRQDSRRIGLLLPSSNSVQEPEFSGVLPDGVTLHVARMRLSNVEAQSTLRIVQEIESESRKLADVDADVIVFAATAPSSRNGIGYDQELIERITAASGRPATTAATALVAALRALSAKRIGIGGPWSAAVNATAAAFVEANGFEVLARETLGHVRNLDIGLLDPQTAYNVGRRLDRPQADAIMLACGNWSTFAIIEQLERDLRKPVLTTNQVSLWHALKMIGNGSSMGSVFCCAIIWATKARDTKPARLRGGARCHRIRTCRRGLTFTPPWHPTAGRLRSQRLR
jgi:maleate isomerase